MNKQRLEAIRFFREHAGYVVGCRLLGAAALADAEHCAKALGWHVLWEHDNDGLWDMSWADKETLRKIDQGVWDVEVASLVDAHGKFLASLGQVIGADSAYKRVVEAELALEANAVELLEGVAA